jgi:hypothetical protein
MSGLTLQIVTVVAVVQWLAFAVISFASRAKTPKSGLRPSEWKLIGSSAALAVVWVLAFGVKPDALQFGGATAASAAAAGSAAKGSCASIEVGMRGDAVRERLGKPDEVRNDEETRGPGTSILVYRGSRCAVHLLDDRVEFVE